MTAVVTRHDKQTDRQTDITKLRDASGDLRESTKQKVTSNKVPSANNAQTDLLMQTY
jgi:hypothetical protein